MVFRNQPPADEFLPTGDLEILQSIRSELEFRLGDRTHDDQGIIGLALRLLQRDLDSRSAAEVVEEVRREMLYRQWRVQSSCVQSSCARDNESGMAGCEPLTCDPQPVSPLGKNSI